MIGMVILPGRRAEFEIDLRAPAFYDVPGPGEYRIAKVADRVDREADKVLLTVEFTIAEKKTLYATKPVYFRTGPGTKYEAVYELSAAYETIKNELGSCDILINGAGGNQPGAITSIEMLKKEKKILTILSGILMKTESVMLWILITWELFFLFRYLLRIWLKKEVAVLSILLL